MQRKLFKSKAVWLRLLPLLLILGACATGTIREKLLTLPVIDGANYVSQETCAECHADQATAYQRTTHGRLADFELLGAQGGCQGCHGPGSLHVDGGGDSGKIFNPAKLSADESAALCAKCHSDGKLMDWTHSEHALADVGCSDCHAMHGETTVAGNLKKADPELCYSCHQEQMAKANFPSHHPVKEGKMVCSDCHNPHGALETEEESRDLCLKCHARHQGPFVFEHAPVEEDCTICHDPHGTVANNLLQQNEPFLCLQCHESHFHAARIGGTTNVPDTFSFDGAALEALKTSNPAAYADIATDGTPLTPKDAAALYGSNLVVPFTNVNGANGWSMAFLTKCTTCHSVVHGSDLPSQTAPVIDSDGDGFPDGGAGLTR